MEIVRNFVTREDFAAVGLLMKGRSDFCCVVTDLYNRRIPIGLCIFKFSNHASSLIDGTHTFW